MPVSGIFPYIGADPVTDFLKPLGVLDEQGYMLVDESMELVPLALRGRRCMPKSAAAGGNRCQ